MISSLAFSLFFSLLLFHHFIHWLDSHINIYYFNGWGKDKRDWYWWISIDFRLFNVGLLANAICQRWVIVLFDFWLLLSLFRFGTKNVDSSVLFAASGISMASIIAAQLKANQRFLRTVVSPDRHQCSNSDQYVYFQIVHTLIQLIFLLRLRFLITDEMVKAPP